MDLAQGGRRLHAELCREPFARVGIEAQGLCLPPCGVERDHEQAHEVLAMGVVANRCLERLHRSRGVSEVEQGTASGLHSFEPEVLEGIRLRSSPRCAREVEERRSAPQAERPRRDVEAIAGRAAV